MSLRPSGDHQAAASEEVPHPCPLLSIPPLPLELIWRALWNKSDRHTLRCTCKGLRTATTPFITCLQTTIEVDPALPDADIQPYVLRESEQHLTAFPSDAMLAKLTWLVTRRYSGCYSSFCAERPLSLPEVLPSLLCKYVRTFAPLQTVNLSGMALTERDLGTLARACPGLIEVELSRVTVSGAALQTLSQLQALRSLALSAYHVLGSTSGFHAGLMFLTTLTQMTSFELFIHPRSADSGVDGAVEVGLELVLSAVTQMRNLQSLSLEVLHIDLDDVGCLHQLSSLTALTSLRLNDTFGHSTARVMPVLGPCLTSLPQLSNLELPDLLLDDEGVRALAALPSLTSVSFFDYKVNSDMSGLPCNWQTVRSWCELSYQQLAWLPLGATTQALGLNLGALRWELKKGESLDTTCQLLYRAAEVVARLSSMLPAPHTHSCLITNWFLDQHAAPSQRLLQALSPLGQGWLHSLELQGKWSLGGDHAQALALHLPCLTELWVDAGAHSLCGIAAVLEPSFVELLGVTLPHLERLLIVCGGQRRRRVGLPDAVRTALRGMMAARASNPDMRPMTVLLSRSAQEIRLLRMQTGGLTRNYDEYFTRV